MGGELAFSSSSACFASSLTYAVRAALVLVYSALSPIVPGVELRSRSTHLTLSASPILIPEESSTRIRALSLGLGLPLVSRVWTSSSLSGTSAICVTLGITTLFLNLSGSTSTST